MTTTHPERVRQVKLYGQPESPAAFELRDFLSRSVVEFEWIEITDEQSCHAQLGLPDCEIVRLPMVEFPDGQRLFAPPLREVATRLGWIQQPRLREYDLSIYGAGPAGLCAAVYAASEGLRTVLVEREAIGGQAGTSSLIENYFGFPDGISGADLAERARQQAVKFGVDILLLREGIRAEFRNQRIVVDLADGSQMIARANICATGVDYRRLGVPNEERFYRLGVFYGAGASEAPLCRDEHVYVVGGGNSAGQAAMHFSRFAKQVTMIVRGAKLSGTLARYLSDRIERTSNIEVRTSSVVTALDGDEHLREMEITNSSTGDLHTSSVKRLFVCIGGDPNTEWAKATAIIRDPAGYLITGPDLLEAGRCPACWPIDRPPFFLETSIPGSFAAGDVRHGSVKRFGAAVGDGAMAVTFVHRFLNESG